MEKPPRAFEPRAHKKLGPVFSEIGVPEEAEFVPDPFQTEALEKLRAGDVLVTAPTGAGKTWIAEQAMEAALARGERIWYASPLKALSNVMYARFGELFGAQRVGILTGDRKENAGADLIVGTTEILRNQLYDTMYRGRDLPINLVIIDEAHFLGDEGRGVVWEEVFIYLPARVPLLMLSATVRNALQVARWLEWLRREPCQVVFADERPVPLYPLFLFPDGEILPLASNGGLFPQVKAYHGRSSVSGKRRGPRRPPNLGNIIAVLRKYNLLPAIFFLKSRADCDLSLNIALSGPSPPSEKQRARLQSRVDRILEEHPHLAHHRQVGHLTGAAVGSHHGGQLPAWKLVVEDLMKEGLLDAIFSTSTVAAGVNFPARTVVITQSDRFNGREFVDLSATDLLQMTGRAGRRGMDNVGFVGVVPGPFQDPRLIAALLNSPPDVVRSRMRVNFSMVLNLLRTYHPEEIRDLFTRSFATFQYLDDQGDVQKELEGVLAKIEPLLEDAGCPSAKEMLRTRKLRRDLHDRLGRAERELKRLKRALFKEGHLTRGRLFLARSRGIYAVLGQRSRGGQDGVDAVRIKKSLSPKRRLRTRFLPLAKVGIMLDEVLPIPADMEEPKLKALLKYAADKTYPRLDPHEPLPEEQAIELRDQREMVARLKFELDSLPCADCTLGRECLGAEEGRLARLIRRAEGLNAKLDAVETSLWRDFLKSLDFLIREGFVGKDDRLTPDGVWASKLRIDQPLLIAQGIRERAFPDHDPSILAGLIAPFVYDRDRDEGPSAFPKYVKKTMAFDYNRLMEAISPLMERLRDNGFDLFTLKPWTAACIFAWAEGMEWEEIVRITGADEGDLASLVFRTADHLRQLTDLRETHPELAECARAAILRILRPPVVVEEEE